MVDGAGVHKAQLFMQGDAALVVGVDTAHQQVVILRYGLLDKGLEQHLAKALAPVRRVHVNGVLNGIFIGRTRPKRAVACKAHQSAGLINSANHRVMAGSLASKPLVHIVHGTGLVVIKGRGMEDGVVEDIKNGLAVSCQLAGDEGHEGVRVGLMARVCHYPAMAAHSLAAFRTPLMTSPSPVTVFFMDTDQCWLLTGVDNQSRHPLSLGLDTLAPPLATPYQLELAIEAAEAQLMPLAATLPAQSLLVLTGPGAECLAALTHSASINLDWVELHFGELALAAERQHPRFDGATRAALLLVRELMHHLGFDSAQLPVSHG